MVVRMHLRRGPRRHIEALPGRRKHVGLLLRLVHDARHPPRRAMHMRARYITAPQLGMLASRSRPAPSSGGSRHGRGGAKSEGSACRSSVAEEGELIEVHGRLPTLLGSRLVSP